ncbi:flagellar biosynthesis protein FliQ [Methylocystis sp. MJC1]|jgi:flagellar biosynthetic protein FliQ|uniref:flagellar biosynthesis protein FliQ n=1 Tax=Methylocystis sp. MJC1 TaxID=2654282 RepID=UPI0013EA0E47|nr:flagellar biosynthesis protein FliQ [Methylocystis sp. MJC1]KAF2990633.1 Flagellar biosynthetic protein FliQ [Methylocystis sp. MJC1]MBU6525706.1 flagellar biosynthesis protein FliQ [Methylocystis sp. MJC1]UZX12177.1 flagellar biosynthesis protein FliQ [Methylocystis sp. MJC1]
MNEADALEMLQRSIVTVLLITGPLVGTALLVGVVASLIQALTQVQEMTLTFVPKMLAMLVVLSLASPFIGGKIKGFTETLYARIETGY